MNAVASVSTRTHPNWIAVFLAVLGSAVGVCAFTWLFIRLIGSYWDYYDIGSAGPDGFVLMGLIPISLVALTSITVFIWGVCWWVRLGVWAAMSLSFIAMLAVTSGAFACEVWHTAGYSGEVQPPISDFLRAFVHDLLTL